MVVRPGKTKCAFHVGLAGGATRCRECDGVQLPDGHPLLDVFGVTGLEIPYACEDEDDLGDPVDAGEYMGCVEVRIGNVKVT